MGKEVLLLIHKLLRVYYHNVPSVLDKDPENDTGDGGKTWRPTEETFALEDTDPSSSSEHNKMPSMSKCSFNFVFRTIRDLDKVILSE